LVAVASQIVEEILDVGPHSVRVVVADTMRTPDGGATTASRQSFVTGNAVRMAALELRNLIASVASEELDASPDDVAIAAGRVTASGGSGGVSLGDVASIAAQEGRRLVVRYEYTPPKTVPLGQEGDAHFAYGYATQVAEVEVDVETGKVRVLRVAAAHDVGKAINPTAVEGQIEGGVVMGIGLALTEQMELRDGVLMTDTLAKYKIPRTEDVPEIVPIIVEMPSAEGPFGAKGVGEIPSIPTVPAIVNAIYDATGVRCLNIPVTPERLVQMLQECREGS
jgi:xanthine dehydrogenase molybdenum-binding subunit